jgi:hypothetical protein
MTAGAIHYSKNLWINEEPLRHADVDGNLSCQHRQVRIQGQLHAASAAVT